jgi:SAM-dependent methyltransferase
MVTHDKYTRSYDGEGRTLLDWDGAPSETQASGPAFAARTHLIDQEFRRLRPRTMVDIGCGRGHVTAIAARHAGTVYATDLADGAVEETRRNLAFHPDAYVACIDPFGSDWPGRGPTAEAFDVALLSEVLEHIEDDVAMLKNVRELLARDGRLVITVPAHMALWTQWDVVAGHVRRYERAELLAKLSQAGFVPERVRTWGFPVTGWLAIRGARMRGERVQARTREIPSPITRAMPVLAPVFRACARAESIFSRTDRGAGYVVVARKV